MKIEDSVELAIQLAVATRYEDAMGTICPAMEATARKLLNKPSINRTEFKNFIRGYYWLFERFGGEGLNLRETVFPNFANVTDSNRIVERPDLADIIYHVHRCASAHGHQISEGFKLIPTAAQGVHQWRIQIDGTVLQFPEAIFWSCVACVVFCSSNSEIVTRSNLFLSWSGPSTEFRGEQYRFDIDLFWGGEDLVKKFFAARPHIRIGADLRTAV